MAEPTPDEAVALALYRAADWVLSYQNSMRRGSGQAKAADRIHHELVDRARRLQLGDLYDPTVCATEESLRRRIAERGEATAAADRLQRAATSAAFGEFDCSLAGMAMDDAPWRDVGRKGAAAVVGELVDVLAELRAQLVKEEDR